jgi:hypothetical protein
MRRHKNGCCGGSHSSSNHGSGCCSRANCRGCRGGGSGSGGSILKFSGRVSSLDAGVSTTYLADPSTQTGTSLTPQGYPIGVARTFDTLAVNLGTTLAGNQSIVVNVLKNGAPTGLTVAFSGAGPTSGVVIGNQASVDFAATDKLDLQAITTGVTGFAELSATLQ